MADCKLPGKGSRRATCWRALASQTCFSPQGCLRLPKACSLGHCPRISQSSVTDISEAPTLCLQSCLTSASALVSVTWQMTDASSMHRALVHDARGSQEQGDEICSRNGNSQGCTSWLRVTVQDGSISKGTAPFSAEPSQLQQHLDIGEGD